MSKAAVEHSATYPKGCKVEHQIYGKGCVVFVEGAGADEKVLVRFGDGSQKKFMVKFAPMSRL